MCEEEYKNPAATEYPKKFKDCQLLIIREALRRYKKYNGLSGFNIADEISGYTGLEIGHDRIDRFLGEERLYKPRHEYVQAIVSFLLSSESNYELKRRHLEIREDSYDIPTGLSRFFLKGGIAASIGKKNDEDEKYIKYDELNAVYKSNVDTEEDTKSITLILRLREKGEFFEVNEFIELIDKKNKDNLALIEFNKRNRMICYEGSGIVMPEGYVLFLMKETEFGKNHIIISSNKFNFSSTKTTPQEFSAVIRDKGINFYDCYPYNDHASFCHMFGKAFTFNKQD